MGQDERLIGGSTGLRDSLHGRLVESTGHYEKRVGAARVDRANVAQESA